MKPLSRRAFTIVELLVVVGIIAILAGLLMPAVSRALRQSQRTQCLSRLHQLGIAFQSYVLDNDGYPCAQDPVSVTPFYWLWMGRGWRPYITPYVDENLEVLYCPSDLTAPQKWESTSYGYSMAFYHSPAQIDKMTSMADTYSNAQPSYRQRISQVSHPSKKVLIAEWLSNHVEDPSSLGWWTWDGARNCLFADGHVQYRRSREILPANDGLPDFNLTVRGIKGQDVK